MIFLMDPLIKDWQDKSMGVLFDSEGIQATVYVGDVYLYAESGRDMETMWTQPQERFMHSGMNLANQKSQFSTKDHPERTYKQVVQNPN